MDDDQTQRDPTKPEYPSPHDVLHNALFDVQIERERLHRAVKANDAEQAMIATTEAIGLWLAARAAFQRITAREAAARERGRQAERALHLSFVSLVDALTGAMTVFDAHLHRTTLEKLRRCLAIAHGEYVPQADVDTFDATQPRQFNDNQCNGTGDS